MRDPRLKAHYFYSLAARDEALRRKAHLLSDNDEVGVRDAALPPPTGRQHLGQEEKCDLEDVPAVTVVALARTSEQLSCPPPCYYSLKMN
jgi:hypothetical protein